MSETKDTALDDVTAMEQLIGMPAAFFRALLSEDDWSFVVKLHLLIEASLTHLLVEVIGKPALKRTLTKLQVGGSSGKLAFADALECLDSDSRCFIKKLSEVRNAFVHDVRNTTLTLTKYVAGLDTSGFQSLSAALGGPGDPIVIKGTVIPFDGFVRENARLCLWIAAMTTVSVIYQHKALASTRNLLTRDLLQLSEATTSLFGARGA